ncbi:MAG: hypothetical protein LBK65_04140 [Tannerellaceae bacterium]|jgi:hypothetical protein|nr:hypothetical protein [Tannerellaceae bacterium]
MKHLGFILVATLVATSACSRSGDPEEGGATIEESSFPMPGGRLLKLIYKINK